MAKTKEKGRVKRTYTLSAETSVRFESLVPPGRRSLVVEGLMQREMEEIEKRLLREAIERGLADMADVNAEISQEWSATEIEGWPNK